MFGSFFGSTSGKDRTQELVKLFDSSTVDIQRADNRVTWDYDKDKWCSRDEMMGSCHIIAEDGAVHDSDGYVHTANWSKNLSKTYKEYNMPANSLIWSLLF